jgi:hypothetical protein
MQSWRMPRLRWFDLFGLVWLIPEIRKLHDRHVTFEREIERANANFQTLQANTDETIVKLSRDNDEKDMQVLYPPVSLS